MLRNLVNATSAMMAAATKAVGENGIEFGFVIGLIAAAVYSYLGFNLAVLVLWFLSLILSGWKLFLYRKAPWSLANRKDVITATILVVCALPLYLWHDHTIPWAINIDEIHIIGFERRFIGNNDRDIFGTSAYFGFPYYPYLILGWLCQALGGITIYHQRELAGFCGALVIGSCYLFFRLLEMRRFPAVAAALIVAFNHSFIAISRMAYKDNGAVLYEVWALGLLFFGLRHRCSFFSYLGGLAAGLCVYQYYSARLSFPVWLCFLALLALKRTELPLKALVRPCLFSALGFCLVVLPFVAATHLKQAPVYFDYQKETLLIYPEARSAMKSWYGMKTEQDALIHNIVTGLTVFNNNCEDEGFQYNNHGHGFCDAFTGILLWLGFLIALIWRREEPAQILMMSGIVVLLLLFGFIITKAPDYTRLLVTLPFVAYFAAQAIEALASIATHTFLKRSAFYPTECALLLVGISLNLWIYHSYLTDPDQLNEPLGCACRYAQARDKQSSHALVMVTDKKFNFFDWEFSDDAATKLSTALGDGNTIIPIPGEELGKLRIMPPFSIFMHEEMWQKYQDVLRRMYPQATLQTLTSGGHLVLEDPHITPGSIAQFREVEQWKGEVEKIHELSARSDITGCIAECKRALGAPNIVLLQSNYLPEVLLSLGSCYIQKGNYQAAEPLLNEAMQREENTSADVSRLATFANTLADLYSREKRWADAEIWFRKELDWRKELFPTPSELAKNWGGTNTMLVGGACLHQNKLPEAIQAFAEAADLYRCNRDLNGSLAALKALNKAKAKLKAEKDP